MRRPLAAALACAAALAAGSCATNPETGSHHVVFSSVKGEQENARRIHQEIVKFYGLYQDQTLQDYVQMVGTRIAQQTPIANWDFHYFVLDDDSLNAFTIGGGYWPLRGFVVRTGAHLRAYVLMTALVMSTFMIVPYLASYLVANTGRSEAELQYVYLVGGACTLLTTPLVSVPETISVPLPNAPLPSTIVPLALPPAKTI